MTKNSDLGTHRHDRRRRDCSFHRKLRVDRWRQVCQVYEIDIRIKFEIHWTMIAFITVAIVTIILLFYVSHDLKLLIGVTVAFNRELQSIMHVRSSSASIQGSLELTSMT
jgi:hypothetical protein